MSGCVCLHVYVFSAEIYNFERTGTAGNSAHTGRPELFLWCEQDEVRQAEGGGRWSQGKINLVVTL